MSINNKGTTIKEELEPKKDTKKYNYTKKTGRPKKEIDYIAVEKLAMMHATQEEIANYLDISVRTLQRDTEFSRIYKKGIDNGKISLRRMQFKLAEKNVAMAVWLGKQYLGQRDKVENIDEEEIKVMIINDVGDEEES